MGRRPLACCALALAAGTLIAPAGLPPAAWCSLAATLLSGGLMLALVSRRSGSISLGGFLVLAAFGCLGGLARDVSARADPSDVGEVVARHPFLLGEGVEIRGRLAGAPWPCPDRLVDAPCLDLTIALTEITVMRISGPVTGRVRLRVAGLAGAPLKRGDRIRAHARLFAPHVYANPGAFDAVRHMRASGIRALGTVKSPRLIQVTARDDIDAVLGFLRSVDRLGRLLADRIDASMIGSPSGNRGAAVGRALLLGDTSRVDPDDLEVLRRAGVSHILAVSGFNVAVLAFVLLVLARAACLAQRWRFVAVLPVLFLYRLVNHAQASLDRAALMAVLTFGGRAFWRPPDPFNSIGLALLVLLGLEPALIHDAGFQLTFVATLSLLIAVGWTQRPGGEAAWNRVTDWLRRGAIAAIAALVGTLPICVMHFNRVTPGALVGNLLIGPLMATALVLLIVLEILAALPGELQLLVAPVIAHLVEWSFRITLPLDSFPFLSYRRITPGLFLCALYYAALAALLLDRLPRALRMLAAATLAVALVVLMAPIDTRQAPEGLRVTVLDVGQGDAILLETPGGDRLLVDAGGRSPGGFDVGERVVSRALWSMGIASIGVLVVTHSDADHAGGAAAIVRNFEPRLVLVPAGSSSWLDRSGARPLRRALAETGTAMTEVLDGFSICLRGGHLQVLHPARDSSASANESSIVLRLGAAGRGVLLPGDAGVETERILLSRAIESDILKAGHHGSRTSTSDRFLDRVRPRIAIISCGPGNRFGHPHPEVLARLEGRARLVLRTDRDGAIEVVLTPSATLLGDLPATSRRGRGAE